VTLTGEILTTGIVNRMPDSLSFELAAMAEPLCSVLASHQKTNTNMHDTVVVLGAGPIGCLLIATAKAQGAKTIVSQRSATRRKLVQQFDPDVVLDPTSEDIVARVQALTGGLGADIVICANPVAATQTQAVEMVCKGGTVVLFGGLPKSNPMTNLDANRIHYGEIKVIGAFSYHPITHQKALDLLARKLIPADKLITHTMPLDDVSKAFEIAASGEGLKVIVTP
jgi:L-iditol 2-dehydrogenase